MIESSLAGTAAKSAAKDVALEPHLIIRESTGKVRR